MAIAPRISLDGPALDPLPIWAALKWLAMAAIAVSVIGIAFAVVDLILPTIFESFPILLTAWSYLGFAQWIVVLGGGALLWLTYRLARNLHALAPNKLSMSPTYAVAMFIVPVVSFFMPPIVIESIERETQVAAGVEVKARPILGWWWLACVLGGLVGGVAQSLMANSSVFDTQFNGRAYEIALMADIVGGALAITAWLLTMRVFGPLATLQSQLVHARS